MSDPCSTTCAPYDCFPWPLPQLNNADVQRAVMGALHDSPELEGLLSAGQLVRAWSPPQVLGLPKLVTAAASVVLYTSRLTPMLRTLEPAGAHPAAVLEPAAAAGRGVHCPGAPPGGSPFSVTMPI